MKQIVEVLDTWFSRRLETIHTALPAMIESYDSKTRIASVKPLVKLKMQKGASVEYPVISGVPVIFPSSGDCLIHFPLRRGDGCLLLFSESGIGNFLSSQRGVVVDADSEARNALTDAIAIPGLWPSAGAPFSDVGDGLSVRYEGVDLNISGGKLKIKGADLELSGSLSVEGEVTAHALTAPVSLSTHIHPTAVGPTSPPTPGT